MSSFTTDESMRDWISRPEWKVLIELIAEVEEDARYALLGADPNDTASIARAQAEVKFAQFFTKGELAEALRAFALEKEKNQI